MSRIEKYQNSIEKFILNKINKFDNNKDIIKYINNNHYFISIFIIIILSIINKKNNNNQYNHSYYISSAMELLLLLKKNNNINNSAKVTSIINLLISDNYNISSNILSKDKLVKYYNLTYKEINTFILNNNFEYNYQDIYELITKLTCFLFGANSNNIFAFITLSKYYSNIIKFYYDMIDFDNNINNSNIINSLGIHKSFEYYIYYKKKFIEISIKINIVSNILYDIIDYIDNYFDIFIEKYKNIIL